MYGNEGVQDKINRTIELLQWCKSFCEKLEGKDGKLSPKYAHTIQSHSYQC